MEIHKRESFSWGHLFFMYSWHLLSFLSKLSVSADTTLNIQKLWLFAWFEKYSSHLFWQLAVLISFYFSFIPNFCC